MSLRLRLRFTRNDTWSDLSWRRHDRNDLFLRLRLRLTRNDTRNDLCLRRNGTWNDLPLRLLLVNRQESVLGNGSWVRISRSKTPLNWGAKR